MYEINRTDISIMAILNSKNANGIQCGITISEIFDAIKNISVKSRMTLYRRLKRLTENGYVAKGVLESHADTFYLLEKGKNALNGKI